MAGFAHVAVDPRTDAQLSTVLSSMLGLAFDRSSLAMLLVDRNAKIICANGSAERLLGEKLLVGRSMNEFSVDADANADAIISGDLDHLEHQGTFLAGSGNPVQVLVLVDAVQVAPDQRYFLVQLADITEDRRRERELALSEHLHQQVVGNLPDTSVIMFDADLRIILAAGESMAANGYPDDLTGVLLTDAFPARVVEILEGPYRDALAGRDADFEYSSPTMGRQFRVRTRAVTDPDGILVGGLSVMEDISADRARRSQLMQVHELGEFGSCRYDRGSGWIFDEGLRRLWGQLPTAGEGGLPIDRIFADDREATIPVWDQTFVSGGRHRFTYRMLHGITGELRYLQCAIDAVVDTAGDLIRAIATHLDVTDAVLARKEFEHAKASAANERIALLRNMGDALAVGHGASEEQLTGIVNLTSVAIGEGAVIRILTAELDRVERDIIAHPDPSIRHRFTGSLHRSADSYDPDGAVAQEVAGRGNIVSRFRTQTWQPEFTELFRDEIFAEAREFMTAPVRHNGNVLGLLTVFRMRPDEPYVAGDDDVLQVFADAAGTAIAEGRLRETVEQGRDLVRELSSHRKDLLDQLAVLETRERSMLAEAIHDEPIQVIVSAVMRLDHLMSRADAESTEVLEDIATQLESSVEWLRNLVVVALTPPDLADGLGVSMKVLADGIFSGTPTVFEVVDPRDSFRKIRSTEAVYRIFREALVNVRNHAQARHVQLRLSEPVGGVELSLTDDGVGAAFLETGGPGHLGLATMRARANAEGGTLTVQSTPGRGTTVLLTLPSHEGDFE